MTDWKRLWMRVMGDFVGDSQSIHGPSHWRRVERNGLRLAGAAGADAEVVRLFAVLHDSRREHDGLDDGHGRRAVKYAVLLRGELFDLADARFAVLQEACIGHTGGRLSKELTVGVCWDADRLDLGRVRIKPSPDYMSTEMGRQVAAKGWPSRRARKSDHDSGCGSRSTGSPQGGAILSHVDSSS